MFALSWLALTKQRKIASCLDRQRPWRGIYMSSGAWHRLTSCQMLPSSGEMCWLCSIISFVNVSLIIPHTVIHILNVLTVSYKVCIVPTLQRSYTMFSLSKIFKPKTDAFHGCTIPSDENILDVFAVIFHTSPKFNLTFLVSLEHLGFTLESKIKWVRTMFGRQAGACQGFQENYLSACQKDVKKIRYGIPAIRSK